MEFGIELALSDEADYVLKIQPETEDSYLRLITAVQMAQPKIWT